MFHLYLSKIRSVTLGSRGSNIIAGRFSRNRVTYKVRTMKKRYILWLVISHLWTYAGLFSQNSVGVSSGSFQTHPNQYFVKLCHGVSNQEVKSLMAELNSVELWKNDRIGLRLWAVKKFPYWRNLPSSCRQPA